MLPFARRARARFTYPSVLVLTAWMSAAAGAAVEESASPLTLDEATRLALTAQPLLAAQAANVRAQDQRAVAAAQLPDPQLNVGIQDLPVNTEEAYSLRRNDFTMLTVGVMQEFPLASKRRLRGEKERLMARGAEDQLDELTRRIRREAGLAFLDVYFPERAGELAGAMLTEAERSRDAIEIAYRAGRAEQADVLAASVSVSLLRDRVMDYRGMAARAQQQLARWIGDAAVRPTAAAMPGVAEPPPLPTLLAGLPRHPALRVYDRNRAAAETELALADQAYRPDWRVGLGYGYRPDFAELVTLNVGVDLPVFTRNRQDRQTNAARAGVEEAQARRADALRELTAQASSNERDWRLLEERARGFQDTVLPQAQARVSASLAAYGAGRGTLASLLDARRTLLDVQLQYLTLTVDGARRRVELQYLTNPESP